MSADKSETVSRLVDQRVRNRIMEELLALSDYEMFVRERGASEYFNSLFDWLPVDDSMPFENSAMTLWEHEAIAGVLTLMEAAIRKTPRKVTNKELVLSGWPQRIASVAQGALAVFMQRGRFSEEREEDMPSNVISWPKKRSHLYYR